MADFKDLEEPLGGCADISVHGDGWLMRQEIWKEACDS